MHSYILVFILLLLQYSHSFFVSFYSSPRPLLTIGKLWDLLEGFQEAESGRERGDETPVLAMNAYGSGPDSQAIHDKAKAMGIPVNFFPATDHAELGQYKTFVNPSESEVLCTTVAEALAMGKFVIIAEHASNEFFYQFPNTLKFKDQEEFNEQVREIVSLGGVVGGQPGGRQGGGAGRGEPFPKWTVLCLFGV